MDKQGTFSYITKDGKDGDKPFTSSRAYNITGADSSRIKELAEQIISAYKD